MQPGDDSKFEGGYPEPETIERAYDEADRNRAIQAYRFFFPTVSGLAMYKGNEAVGIEGNRVFGAVDTTPDQAGFTLNSDTPYGPILLDLRDGPLIVEMPEGPLICVAVDLNQRWVADMGLPGPEAGRGARHLILPPGWEGDVPEDGYHVWQATTLRLIAGVRSLPIGGDLKAAHDRLKTIKVRPLDPGPDWVEPTWKDLNGVEQQTSPVEWETNIEFWRHLHEVIDTEPHLDGFRPLYGELAALGIAKGSPFEPDTRMTEILVEAARAGNEQMRVQSLADRRPDRVAWSGKQWEWAALRFENGDFEADGYLDTDAREKWFFQAIAASPAMFRREPGAGSLYWLGLRDSTGAYLDGGEDYTLTVPQPVPGKLFWSLTVYDAETRSQIKTDRSSAAIRSLFEAADAPEGPLVLSFGPEPPDGGPELWVKTIPRRGWFAYFRIYGPEQPAFDGSWQLPDFEAS